MVCFWASGTEANSIAQVLGISGFVLCFLILLFASTAILFTLQLTLDRVIKISWNAAPVLASRYIRTVWVTVMVFVNVTVALLMETAAPEIIYKAF